MYMYIFAAISFSFNFGLTLMLIFFLLLCDLFAVYIQYFLFVMLFLPHNLLVLIFLSALFLFICFADFLINLPKYKFGRRLCDTATSVLWHNLRVHLRCAESVVVLKKSIKNSFRWEDAKGAYLKFINKLIMGHTEIFSYTNTHIHPITHNHSL